MKKTVIVLSVLLFLLLSCVSESETDAHGKIKEAELALKNLGQILDKYNQVYGYYPYLSEDVDRTTKTLTMVIDENGIRISSNNSEISVPLVDSAEFYSGLGKVMYEDDEYLLRRWYIYVAGSNRRAQIETLNTVINFEEAEDLSAIIRIKDTICFVAIRDGDSTKPYHIYYSSDKHIFTVTDSALIGFIPGTYELTYTELIGDREIQTNRNASWLFDTLSQFGDTVTLAKIKSSFVVDSLRYITTDPYRKYFLYSSANDMNRTIVTSKRIVKGSSDLSIDNIITFDPVVILGLETETISSEEEIIEEDTTSNEEVQ